MRHHHSSVFSKFEDTVLTAQAACTVPRALVVVAGEQAVRTTSSRQTNAKNVDLGFLLIQPERPLLVVGVEMAERKAFFWVLQRDPPRSARFVNDVVHDVLESNILSA